MASQVDQESAREARDVNSFSLSSGRRVRLAAFHFEGTYAGLLAGLPKNELGYITDQENRAKTIWGGLKTFTVPPIPLVREHGGKKYDSWPSRCYQASLTSDAINPDGISSQLVVIWFSEDEADLSVMTIIERGCSAVDWETHAEDFNF
jgi:hypothetical protein